MAKDDWRGSGAYDLDDEPEELEIVETGYGRYRPPDAEEKEEEKARIEKSRRRLIATIAVIAVGVIALIVMSGKELGQTETEKLQGITNLEEAVYLFADEDITAVGNIRRRFGSMGDLLPFNDGIVATYLFLEHPVEIWVGIAALQELASDAYSLLLEETDPELNPDSPWRTQSQFVRQGFTITQVVGRGQRNYFYQDSNMIVWITADSVAATFALNASLNTNLRDWIASLRQGAP
ncbi:MAG: hypothetical protein KAT18_06605 [Candidatus Latescibacteria bacterium]|nr:hypothetical protein [Candidatus Latescibacterota bacterium]